MPVKQSSYGEVPNPLNPQDIASKAYVDSSAGQSNTVSDVGIGVGKIFKQKVGVDLEFKSLLAGLGITINNLTDEVEIVNDNPTPAPPGSGDGLTLGAQEESLADGTTDVIFVNTIRYDQPTVLPTDFEYFVITHVVPKIGGASAGNIIAGCDLVDASPPVSPWVEHVAITRSVAVGPINTYQEIPVMESALIRKGAIVMPWCSHDNTGANVHRATVSSRNNRKTGTFPTTLSKADGVAWIADVNEVNCKFFFRGVGKAI